MKKLLSLILVIVLVFSVSGCFDSTDSSSSVADTTIYLNGVALEDYTIVVSENANQLTLDAALILEKYVLTTYDIDLEIVTDSTPEAANEIIIGNTKRNESASLSNSHLPKGNYLLTSVGGDIVAIGESYLVGAGVGDIIENYINVGNPDVVIPEKAKPKELVFDKADSAILMIGDGMGENHIKAAYQEKTIEKFFAEDLPNISYVNTTNATFETTDSAASGTAMATGVKTTNSFLGLSPSEKRLTNITDVVYKAGGKSSIVTTDSLYGATPSAFVAHVNDRANTDVIKMHFDNALSKGWVTYAKGSLKDEDFMSTATDYLWDISKNGGKFFTMIEEAYTDKGSHSNDMEVMTHAVSRFNRLISYCIEYTVIFPRVALIITADHETGGIQNQNGEFVFTTTNHTSTQVKLFALGKGTEALTSKELIENTEIAHFIAAIYGETKLNK